jgi:hypothetical protein
MDKRLPWSAYTEPILLTYVVRVQLAICHFPYDLVCAPALLFSFMAIFSSWNIWILTVVFVNPGAGGVSGLSNIHFAAFAGNANYICLAVLGSGDLRWDRVVQPSWCVWIASWLCC